MLNGHWLSRFACAVACAALFATIVASAAETLPKHALLRLGSNRFVHGSYIQELALIPESSEIITIGGDHSDAVLWSKDGDVSRTTAPPSKEYNVSISMCGRWRLSTVPRDGAPQERRYVRGAVNLVSGEKINLGTSTRPSRMSLSADGSLLAVGVPGAELLLIDVQTTQTLAKIALPSAANDPGDPRIFLSPDAALLMAEQPAGQWHVYDLKERNLEHPLPALDPMIHAKPVLASKRGIGAMIGWNGKIVVRDLYQGTNLAEFQHGNVTALDGAFSPDDKILATCGADGFIRLWELPEGKLFHEINTEERRPFAVAFTADGAGLLSGGGRGQVRFWSVATGEETVRQGASELGMIAGVALSPDARKAALAGELGDVELWSLTSGKSLGVLPDKDIQGRRFDPWIGHNFLTFAPGGLMLVAGSSNRHNSINLWDVEHRQRLARLEGHAWPITCVAYSPKGELIVSGSRDKTIRAWDVTGKQLWQATGNGEQVLTLAIAPSGKRIYSAGHTNTIDVWSAKDGGMTEQIVIPAQGPNGLRTVSALSVSSGNHYLAAVIEISTAGHRVVAVDLETKAPVFQIGEEEVFAAPAEATYYCLAFHPMLDVLAVGAGDGSATLFELRTGAVIERLSGHAAAVNSLSWSADGNRMLTGSADGTAILWNTAFVGPQ